MAELDQLWHELHDLEARVARAEQAEAGRVAEARALAARTTARTERVRWAITTLIAAASLVFFALSVIH